MSVQSLAAPPPLGSVLDDPIREGPLESDVIAGLLGFDPLVLQYLFTFGLKFAVKRRVSDQIGSGSWIIRGHKSQPYILITHDFIMLNHPYNPNLEFCSAEEVPQKVTTLFQRCLYFFRNPYKCLSRWLFRRRYHNWDSGVSTFPNFGIKRNFP